MTGSLNAIMGDLPGAVGAVMEEVRRAPTALPPRQALFQLSCLLGDWDRAIRQLEVMVELDPETSLMARVYTSLVSAEAERRAVLSGTAEPICLGEPPAWVALLVRALAVDAGGATEKAYELRRQALTETEPSSGTVDGIPFSWVMDADLRFGPVLEVIVNGAYRWLPVQHLAELRSDPPAAVRDLVWLPVQLVLASGGHVHAFLPVRYPGSEASPDAAVRLARATHWEDRGADAQAGLGQRLLATDVGDHPVLDIRRVVVDRAAAAKPEDDHV